MQFLQRFLVSMTRSLRFDAGAQFRLNFAKGTAARKTLFALCPVLAVLMLGLLGAPSRALAGQASGRGLAANVDPLIGTGHGPGGGINLFPGPTMPFGLARPSPDTENHGFGYHYFQPDIQGFSMLHGSGPGWSSEGEVFFTATAGPIRTAVKEFESPYSHSHESAAAGYYQVLLQRWGVNAELTATDHTGLARFTFPAGKAANILVPISHTLNQSVAAEIQVKGDREITGYVANWVGNRTFHQPYKVYFVMRFSRPFSSFGTWQGNKPQGPGETSASSRSAAQTHAGQWVGAYASWPSSSHSQTVVAKIGISFVDVAGAENNLKVEAAGKSFDQVRHDAWAAWNKELKVIQVSGGTPSEHSVFYTALYHSMLSPCMFNDADGRYIGFDDKTHHVTSGHMIYASYSGWDIYRSEIPLLALIEPQRMEDMAQSLVLMYQQGGWMGRRPLFNRFTNAMAGSPITVMLANAWLDGLHGFNIKAAWEGMLKDATVAPPPGRPYVGETGIEWINKLHYVPNDKIDYGSVSQLQEECIAYASLYDLAVKLGKTQDAKMLYQRALYYRNVFDHQDRFFRPRNADGQWTPDFDPARERHKPGEPPTGFIEGSGWHYQWFVPADLAWVIHAMGKNLFNQRLEKFFSYPKPGWYGQYYNPYNETDLEAPFEFNFSGMPWESQRAVRRVLRENYTTSPDGIPGNDDCGEMSSWAVFTMMGIYTVDPASLAYELVSPVFHKVIIRLQAPYQWKTFTIEAPADAAAKPYIQSVKLNGHEHSKNWIGFQSITAGGRLQFALGREPNKSWGSAPQDAPPSLSEAHP
ncbi:MAG TPA: GH92 family glycosyl hydrolase [Terriglobia bacterium]|nr:GH92 family glycosyl hydrolase [Terriglobia bacterium]